MALLISEIGVSDCEHCGSPDHRHGRVQVFYCYAGREKLLEIDPETGHQNADTYDVRQGHAVEVPHRSTMGEMGWGKRGGRLPICPEHRTPEDPDWPV